MIRSNPCPGIAIALLLLPFLFFSFSSSDSTSISTSIQENNIGKRSENPIMPLHINDTRALCVLLNIGITNKDVKSK